MVLTPLVRRFAHRFGLYDQPDERKVHQRVVPRLGGLAIAIAFAVPVIGLLFYLNAIGETLAGQESFLASLLVGGGGILALGLLDDIRGCSHRIKFLVQITIAVFTVYVGCEIRSISIPGFGLVQLGVLGPFITIAWIVGVVNAVNLIDGLDGLASGVCFFAVLTLFMVGLMDDSRTLCVISAALCGSLIGFLFFNFNPATIFMGDSGSMFLGYVLAILSVATMSKGPTIVALAVPLLALGLPIFDTFLAIIRRVYQRRPVFMADRGHIHHRLLALGLTHRQVVLFLYMVCSILALSAVVTRATRDFAAGGTLLLLGIVVFAIVHLFRFKDIIAQKAENRILEFENRIREHAVLEMRKIGAKVRASNDMRETWTSLKEAARFLEITRMTLRLHIRPTEVEDLEHELKFVATRTDIETRSQRIEIPLSGQKFLYGELIFEFPVTGQIDLHRRSFMFLMSEYLVEFFERAFKARGDEIFVVQRHPAQLEFEQFEDSPAEER